MAVMSAADARSQVPSTEARIATANASKLLRTLCNHWRHKFDLNYSDDRAHIPFSAEAHVAGSADATGLTMTISHTDATQLPQLQTVVAEHLQRFAREETLVFEWQPATSVSREGQQPDQ
jgi:hypothetical protein